MSRYTIEFNDEFNKYFVTSVKKYLKSNYSKEQLTDYIEENYDIFDLVAQLHANQDSLEGVILTTEELKDSCKTALEQEYFNDAMCRAYALWTDSQEYCKARYWCYNGNPVPITKTAFIEVVKMTIKEM